MPADILSGIDLSKKTIITLTYIYQEQVPSPQQPPPISGAPRPRPRARAGAGAGERAREGATPPREGEAREVCWTPYIFHLASRATWPIVALSSSAQIWMNKKYL